MTSWNNKTLCSNPPQVLSPFETVGLCSNRLVFCRRKKGTSPSPGPPSPTAREPNSPPPMQGDEAELGLLDIACVGRVVLMQAQICFHASHARHELGSLCSEPRSELLSCKLRTAGNARRVPQPTASVDYRPQNHEEPGSELASEYKSRLQGNLIRSGHSGHHLRRTSDGVCFVLFCFV